MAQKFMREEKLLLPADLDYSTVHGISTEERHALERVRPESIGMARRIEGVTPTGTLRLLMHVHKMNRPTGDALSQDNNMAKDETSSRI
jgi:tRNA uridine 5-carboxymethylaminomethyl modification enzyme